MLKKILLSALVLGALAATVGAGSLSAFTTSGDVHGTLALGTVHLQTFDGTNWNDSSTVDFTPTNLTPGHYATEPTYIRNTGTADIGALSVTPAVVIQSGNGGCVSYVSVSYDPIPSTLAAGTQFGPFNVYATLASNAPDACQGATFLVTSTFSGSTT